MSRWLSVLLAGLLASGCASLDADGLWALPPLTPAERGPASPPVTVAAVGTGTVPGLGQTWQVGRPLLLGQLLSIVDETYPLLSAVRQERVIAAARQLSALGAFDPKLSAGATWAPTGFYEHHTAGAKLEQRTGLWGLRAWGGYRLGSGDFDPTFDGKRVTNHGGELHAGVSLPLLRGGSIDRARRDLLTSGLDREIADSEVATRRLRFTREAALSYWRWVAAGRRLEVARSLLGLAEERQKGIRARVLRGDLPELEQVDNRRLVVRRRALLIAAQRQLQRTAFSLSLFLRDGQGAPLLPPLSSLPDRFPAPARPAGEGLEVDIRTALANRPELKQIAQRRGRTGVELRLAENQLLPQVDVFVSGSQDLDGRSPSVTKGEFELVAGVAFSFPLLNRKARGEVRAGEAKLRQLTDTERFLRDKIAVEVRDALSALQAAYRRVALERESAALARRVAAGERRRFGLGDSTILLLNLREESVAEADLRVIEAQRAYWSATATYRAAVGQVEGAPTKP